MCGNETFAIEVSSVSMNVASITDTAMSHGFTANFGWAADMTAKR
jgi:hypothetical protein